MKSIKMFFKKIYKFIDKKIIIPITKFFVFIGNKIKITDKPFEAALARKNSMIIISLVLSVIVFFIVDTRSTTLLETNAEVIYNRPVRASYNDEEYVIEGLPETVDITLIGTKSNLYLAKQLPMQDVTIDLSDLKPGVHKVNLRYKQSITSVEYKLDPSVATVVVSTKKSETRDVEYDVINLTKLDSKLAISNVKLDTNEVIIKGTEENLEKVSKIKALVNVKDMVDPKSGDNILKDIPLIAYDEDGKAINVEMVPKTVNATIEIESPSKEVPIKVVTTGNVVFGKSIKSITSSVDKVTIYGDSKTLDKTENIEIKVDVSDLRSTKQYNKTIKRPSGIREISEKNVSITIELDDESTTELSGVRLGYINLDSKYTVQAANESATEITVILKGVESVISKVDSTTVEAYVDLKGLGVGEHEVEIEVKGNDPKVNYSSKVKKTTIKIAEK